MNNTIIGTAKTTLREISSLALMDLKDSIKMIRQYAKYCLEYDEQPDVDPDEEVEFSVDLLPDLSTMTAIWTIPSAVHAITCTSLGIPSEEEDCEVYWVHAIVRSLLYQSDLIELYLDKPYEYLSFDEIVEFANKFIEPNIMDFEEFDEIIWDELKKFIIDKREERVE